jgi:hypothetical protein
LPICDLIVYFFSAAVPLDSADIPLLQEQATELPFIPIHFVVTRADEFKIEYEKPLSSENFDRSKSDNFLGEFSNRVHQLFPGRMTIDVRNFSLVDNMTQFNIDGLREYLLNFTHNSGSDGRLDLHSHKIRYFQSTAKGLQDFFCTFLSGKLESLKTVLDTAESNIQRFEGKIRVTNNTLTASWNEKLDRINSISREIVKGELMEPASLPSSISDFSRQAFSSYQYSIERENIQFFESFKKDLISQVKKQLAIFTTIGKKQVNGLTALKSVRDTDVDFSSFQVSLVIDQVNIEPLPTLRSQSNHIVSELDQTLLKIYEKLSKQSIELGKYINGNEPISEYQRIIDEACSSLACDFDDYFESISAYRTSVFSMGTKAATEKLGLGEQMDNLELNKFTDDQKQDIKQGAQSCVFPDTSIAFSRFAKGVSSLKNSADELQKGLKILKMEKTPLDSSEKVNRENQAQSLAVKNDLSKLIEACVKRTQQSINMEIKLMQEKYDERWREEVEILKSRRKKRLLLFMISSAALASLVYILYIFGGKSELANNLFVAFLFGIATNLVSSLFGWWLGKLTDDFPVNIKSKESMLLSDMRNEYSVLIDTEMDKLPDLLELDKSFLLNAWNRFLIQNPKSVWEVERGRFYASLKDKLEEFSGIHGQYLNLVEKLERSHLSIFLMLSKIWKNLINFLLISKSNPLFHRLNYSRLLRII